MVRQVETKCFSVKTVLSAYLIYEKDIGSLKIIQLIDF